MPFKTWNDGRSLLRATHAECHFCVEACGALGTLSSTERDDDPAYSCCFLNHVEITVHTSIQLTPCPHLFNGGVGRSGGCGGSSCTG